MLTFNACNPDALAKVYSTVSLEQVAVELSTDVEETGTAPIEADRGNRGNGDRRDVDTTQYAGAFSRLTPATDTPTAVPSPSPDKPLFQNAVLASTDPLKHYFSQGFDVRLAAALTVPARNQLFYRVSVYQSGTKVDEFTQDEVRAYGYQEEYGAAGLRLMRDDSLYLVRPFRGRLIAPNSQNKGPADSNLSIVHM